MCPHPRGGQCLRPASTIQGLSIQLLLSSPRKPAPPKPDSTVGRGSDPGSGCGSQLPPGGGLPGGTHRDCPPAQPLTHIWETAQSCRQLLPARHQPGLLSVPTMASHVPSLLPCDSPLSLGTQRPHQKSPASPLLFLPPHSLTGPTVSAPCSWALPQRTAPAPCTAQARALSSLCVPYTCLSKSCPQTWPPLSQPAPCNPSCHPCHVGQAWQVWPPP